MSALDLAVLALACWRLTSLAVSEDGPYDVLAKMRSKIGVRYDEHSQAYGANIVAEAFTCAWCLSVWLGAALVICYALAAEITVWLSLPFALSAVVVLLGQGGRHG